MSSILPRLNALLVADGWRIEGAVGDFTNVWKLRKAGEIVAAVRAPRVPNLSGFDDAVRAVVDAIAVARGSTTAAVRKSINSVYDDVVRFALPTLDSEPETISVHAAGEIVPRMKSCATWSAAVVADKPRRCFSGPRSKQVDSYVAALRMGHTEQGSFVFPMHAPVVHHELPLFEEAPPADEFRRKAMETLLDAVTAVAAAAEVPLKSREEAIDAAVSKGLSANLCDSLEGILQFAPKGELKIEVTWSPVLPTDRTSGASVVLKGRARTVLRAAALSLRDPRGPEQAGVQGWVVRLEKEKRLAEDGFVRLETKVGGKKRILQLELDHSGISTAIRAYERGEIVSVRGLMVGVGRQWFLKDPHDLRIVSEATTPATPPS